MRFQFLKLAQGIAMVCSMLAAAGAEAAEICAPDIANATQLVVVTTKSLNDVKATIRLFERANPTHEWTSRGPAGAAVVGKAGLAWPWSDANAPKAEPRKKEGDSRTPIGIFRIGRPFGFAASTLPGYIKLEKGQTICVDDPESINYNRILPKAEAGKDRGEDMGAEPLYKHGLVIDFASSASARGGSCIFIHIWRASDKGTGGCVAMPEPVMADLQNWVKPGAHIAILPESAKARFAACLPKEVR